MYLRSSGKTESKPVSSFLHSSASPYLAARFIYVTSHSTLSWNKLHCSMLAAMWPGNSSWSDLREHPALLAHVVTLP